MDAVRHWLAVILVVSYPPGVAYWYVVHPFAHWWRRLGARASLWVLLPLLGIAVWAGFQVREVLIGRDLGFSWITVVLGVALYLASLGVERACRRFLRLSVLAGVPELSKEEPGRILNEGIYSRIRHPRYLGVLLGTGGWALLANHAGAYLVTALASLSLFGVVLLEERELRARFGQAYVDYSARVPRFLPRAASASRP